MSAEVERVKKLAAGGMIVGAVEIPTSHRSRPLVAEDLEEALAEFDDDADHAHFLIRVKRASQPLPKPLPEPQAPQLSIDSLVTETMQLTEEMNYEPEFLTENARLLEESGDFTLARNIYAAMVQRGQLIPQALFGIGRTHEKEGNNERAIRCYREAIAYSSELPFYQALAALQIRLGNDEDAAETLVHALGMTGLDDEQRFEIHKSLGNCQTRLGEYAAAEHHYRKAYELNSKSDVLQVNVGSLALQKGDQDSAFEHFKRAIELNPNNDKAVSGLGMVCLGLGRTPQAYDQFVASLKLNPNNLGAIYNLVKCAYELKKFEEAAGVLKRYIECNPVNTNILYSYAGILFHQGEHEAARTEVEKILKLNLNHAGAKELEALIRAKTRSG